MDVFNATWTSSDQNVATADPNGFVTGQGAGSATISARWTLYTYHFSPALGGCTSSSIQVTRTATVTVKSKIDSITPARGLVGNTIAVSIDGHGFGVNPTVNAGNGITATVNFANSTSFHIDASFAISANASGGNHAVTVTVGGQTSNSVNFFVQIPTSLALSIASLRTHNGGSITDCRGTVLVSVAYGYSRLLTYTVLDQTGAAIMQTGMTATEQVYKVSSNPSNAGGDFTSSAPVGSDGTFCDVQAFFTTSPPPPQGGEYIKLKQLINITVPGRLDAVRVNCIDQEYYDVFITDTTSNPNATCQ